jgi:hypothetical protein
MPCMATGIMGLMDFDASIHSSTVDIGLYLAPRGTEHAGNR